MKRILLLVFTLMLLLLTACGNDIRGDSSVTMDPLHEKPKETVLAQGDNFEVKAIDSEGVTKFSYTVTADDGTLMESALCAEEPVVAAVAEHVLGIRFTQDNHRFSRYFDCAQGIVSESFMDAFWDNGKCVAYLGYDNGHVLIVRDIFDKSVFFEETPVDCSSWQLTVYEIVEQPDSILVRYYMGLSEDSNNGIGQAVLPVPSF